MECLRLAPSERKGKGDSRRRGKYKLLAKNQGKATGKLRIKGTRIERSRSTTSLGHTQLINSFASARELFRQGFESSLYKKYMNENGNPEKKTI